jgi:hypothetical protein
VSLAGRPTFGHPLLPLKYGADLAARRKCPCLWGFPRRFICHVSDKSLVNVRFEHRDSPVSHLWGVILDDSELKQQLKLGRF